METIISAIHKEKAWELRHKVMWPEKHFDFIKLADDDTGIHYGLFKGNDLVSVISLFVSDEEAQFRKFATLSEEQGKGYGSALLQYVLMEAEKLGIKKIWCNARKNKAAFYQKFSLHETGESFKKEDKEYVIMEREIG
ncbi:MULTISPECIES: GNAT family N-acetyltransferase [Bacillaceae]|uniref:GNAT family N-acetyltransferase n=1 Tax=Bacillaceae TaxID=186817 RepID=UPI001E3CFFE0|nr:GNAT family N-acetyltransferase [Bacillus sp. Au-Bac7]MCE4049195.1 GNAT family N-acetyltransferase [Bacillus sp. Au-Bac7]